MACGPGETPPAEDSTAWVSDDPSTKAPRHVWWAQRRVRAYAGPEAIALQPHAVVYTSLRRLHAYGVRDFVAWYNDADRTGKEVDVR